MTKNERIKAINERIKAIHERFTVWYRDNDKALRDIAVEAKICYPTLYYFLRDCNAIKFKTLLRLENYLHKKDEE